MFRVAQLLVYIAVAILALHFVEFNKASASPAPQPCRELMRELMDFPRRPRPPRIEPPKNATALNPPPPPNNGTAPPNRNTPQAIQDRFDQLVRDFADLLRSVM